MRDEQGEVGMSATTVKDFVLVELTFGPHRGEVWRTERMSEDTALEINRRMEVMKWIPVDEIRKGGRGYDHTKTRNR